MTGLNIILELLFAFLEIYFINRVIILFCLFLSFIERKKLWIFILLTIVDSLLLYFYGITPIINAIRSNGSFIGGIIYSVLVLLVYIQNIAALHIKLIFKNKSQRSFNKIMKKESNYAVVLLISIVVTISGIISWIYYQKNYTSSYKDQLIISRGLTIVGALVLVLTIVKIIFRKNGNTITTDNSVINQPLIKRNKNIMFILDVNGNVEVYQKLEFNSNNINDLFQGITDYYYINNYGLLDDNGVVYELYGLKTSDFDVSLYSKINMDRLIDTRYEKLALYVNKNNRKTIKLDENKNPIDSFEA